MNQNNKTKIVVIGSSNIDQVMKVEHLPFPGETVGNGKFEQAYGGKGANQAVAAARLGGEVEFVTYLGNDIYADILKNYFSENGINTEYILTSEKNATGIAMIYVSKDGENCIGVAPGANYELTINSIQNKVEDILEHASLLIMQAEIPYETVKYLLHLAHEKKVKVLYNPAPAHKIEPEEMKCINYLVVNQGESEEVSGLSIEKVGLETIVNTLLETGVENVIVTLGKDGVYFKNQEKEIKVEGFQVDTVDTTGAGDTFCGALGSRIIKEGEVTEQVLQYCCAASAISVTRSGAQPSIPVEREVVQFLKIKNICI